MVHTIVFDVGEVLFTGFYGMEKVIGRELGLSIKNSDLQTDELRQFFRGEIREERMWELMIERFGWRMSTTRAMRLQRSHFSPVAGTLRIARELKKAGYLTALLSVHGKEWVEYLDSVYNHHRTFAIRCYSHETGLLKPDPAAFIDLSEQTGTEPNDCLFIDDDPRNITAAAELGFNVHHFTGSEELRAHLSGLELRASAA